MGRLGFQSASALALGLSVPALFPQYYPQGGWETTAKVIVADVLSTLGYGDYEEGVFDRPQPSVPVILHPAVPEWEPTVPDEEPVFSGIYTPGQEPTDWDAVYREYEILNPAEEEPVAHDWGHLIRQGIETVTGIGQPTVFDPPVITNMSTGVGGGGGGVIVPPTGGGALCPPSGSCSGPRYLTYDCKTGQMSVRRRRRRRRLLTDGDKQDLGTIVAMFGKGAAAQIALAAAVKR